MALSCEVCAALGRTPAGRSRRVPIADRELVLCASHAEQLEGQPLPDAQALRATFPESAGQRSVIQRREALDRRAFPPRPEGRRRSGGRRDADRR